ncbi:MAG TPA: class I SAM-dependent methyltransferase [Bryobacteraceae bacterium]|nr:class I SAM-dependent methyltransferase [Bryobacteraceae bacterium]
MTANPYDEVPYPTLPQPQTHPERLAAVGRLFGMRPAPVEGCRVLEIGCGDGGNLIPMAYALPASRFVGVDLAAVPIAAGKRMAADLALGNLALRACDLREIDAGWGEFDYILAHGVFSWVPEEVRERLLAVCGERLALAGIALVSYNALPGGYLRQMLREMLLHHTRHAKDAAGRIGQAREFLKLLERSHLLSPPWQALRDYEVKALLARDDGSLYHDELAGWNQRFYFHEFAEAARRHGLEYLGEAEPHEMFDPSGALGSFSGGIIEREQYLDFLKARRFRQTLLCRAGTALRRDIQPPQMREFLFSAPGRRLANGQIEGARAVRITPAGEAAVEVALALGEVDPLPLPFDDLIPYAGGAEALEQVLYAFMTAGFADLHVFEFPCQDSVTDRPRASRLVRYQAARSHFVSSACHVAVPLDEAERRLAKLLDGTCTHPEIAAALDAPGARDWLEARLEWMAAQGLLEG